MARMSAKIRRSGPSAYYLRKAAYDSIKSFSRCSRSMTISFAGGIPGADRCKPDKTGNCPTTSFGAAIIPSRSMMPMIEKSSSTRTLWDPKSRFINEKGPVSLEQNLASKSLKSNGTTNEGLEPNSSLDAQRLRACSTASLRYAIKISKDPVQSPILGR